ncbi:hypothetical protein TIFTF001_014807 [Ficus carica]|uniref:Uncharacterized protein n=1 Tax=Ficus carica TaxID=3494 RepID=A0AA88D7A1_FICCA|nr:hypothetical protein TIFTF001_014807 [Ficus carica]
MDRLSWARNASLLRRVVEYKKRASGLLLQCRNLSSALLLFFFGGLHEGGDLRAPQASISIIVTLPRSPGTVDTSANLACNRFLKSPLETGLVTMRKSRFSGHFGRDSPAAILATFFWLISRRSEVDATEILQVPRRHDFRWLHHRERWQQQRENRGREKRTGMG